MKLSFLVSKILYQIAIFIYLHPTSFYFCILLSQVLLTIWFLSQVLYLKSWNLVRRRILPFLSLCQKQSSLECFQRTVSIYKFTRIVSGALLVPCNYLIFDYPNFMSTSESKYWIRYSSFSPQTPNNQCQFTTV
jgi:hypothetical protein